MPGALDGLTAQTLGSSQTFNWTWFIELVTCGILVLWFLFYLNRLFATIVSYGIRTYSWHKFRVYIDIKSLQLSFLGGRVFFKGVRYHGENETVYVHNGHITWRYWLRATKQIDLTDIKSQRQKRTAKAAGEKRPDSGSTDSAEGDESFTAATPTDGEARISVFVSGLEWFIYNRTPVYDSILQDAGARASSSASNAEPSYSAKLTRAVENKLRKRSRAQQDSEDAVSLSPQGTKESGPKSSFDEEPAKGENDDRHSVASRDAEAETEVSAFYSFMLRFFPVGLECSKGAVSIGNEHTKAIVVTTFTKARGYINAAASGPADIFRQVFDFDIEHPVVQMKPNPDYRLPQMAAAERIIAGSEAVLKRRPWWRPNLHLTSRRRALSHGLRNLVPHFRRSVASLHGDQPLKNQNRDYAVFADAQPDSHDWHGLDRYMDEDEGDDHHAWLGIEYARFSTILDCPRIHLNFYWDTAGAIKSEHLEAAFSGMAADLNGIEPPAYGMHLDVYGGLVNYGPWSDRLRVEIQNEFIPASWKTALPKQALSNGDTRLSSVMNITVTIQEEITLRIPTRESSKDWRFRGRATAVRDAAALRKQQQRRHFRFRRSNKRRLGPDVRPFGWLSVAAGADSKVQYVMDMYPGLNGYRNTLELALKSTKATSSVNHAVLWECRQQDVTANLSNPLIWNDLHSWRFDIGSKGMDLFLLRDHTFLLLDLISDFTAGLKSDYMTFMPFHYAIGVDFVDFNLYLNANDQNIVDNPCDLDENAFLILGFSKLAGQIDIPMKYFSPPQSSVHFRGNGQDAGLTLKTPLWHTLHTFGSDETMATLKTLQLYGTYNYFAETSPTLTDSLVMDIVGGYPKFHLQGFLIRYFMNVKDNYFGDIIHFSTLEEYQVKLESRRNNGEDEKKPPLKKMNDLDVILSVQADNAAALMPANIYTREENLRVDVLLVEADMRFTNYYMDLQVNSSPIEVSFEKDTVTKGKVRRDASACQLFIDGVTVYGHRLFGAPPTEPTYLCNWDFDVGTVLGECTTDFVRVLVASIMAFVFTIDDDENALPLSQVVTIPDVTFLRMRAAGIRTWIVSAETAFLLDLGSTTVELNDWANKHFSKYVKVNVPSILVAAVDSISAYRQKDTPDKAVPTLACFRTSIRLAVLNRKAQFAHNSTMQQKHIHFHDLRTHRSDWLLHGPVKLSANHSHASWSRQPPAMPIPLMPDPLSRTRETSHVLGFRESLATSKARLGDNKLDQINTHIRPEAKIPTVSAGVPVSSPWARPHFQLRRVQPDVSRMPDIVDAFRSTENGPADTMEDDDFPTSDDSFQHDGLFFDLAEGVVGFCSPDVIQSVVVLLNEISPQRPESMLDDLQMQVVSNIKKTAVKHIDQIDDLAFRLPAACLRVLNSHKHGNLAGGFDQHDLSLNNVRATVRIAPEAHAKNLKTQILTHASVQSLRIEAAECVPDVQLFMSGAELVVSEASLWLSLTDEIRAQTQVSSAELVIAGKNLDNLAGLIERSERAVSRAVERFGQIDMTDRLQHMVYHLTSVNVSVDPPFLSRPAYVLRTAEEHVRLQDSWKMVCRLRETLNTHPEAKHNIIDRKPCSGEEASEKRHHILSSFDYWKSWEGSDREDDALVQAVFGLSKTAVQAPHSTTDTEVEVLVGHAAVTVDPGPKQSQTAIQCLDLNFAEKLPERRTPDYSLSGKAVSRKIVQAYCGTLACMLNWELFGLVERIVTIAQSHASSAEEREPVDMTSGSEQSDSLDLSFVLGADEASIEMLSTNLQLMTGLQRFKTSATVSSTPENRRMASMTLNASSGRLRLRGSKRSILGCKVTIPTIYAGLTEGLPRKDNKLVLHVAATGEKLRLHLKEDVLGLLGTVQAVLDDEVIAIQRLVKTIPSKPASHSLNTLEKSENRKLEPHVALFLDDYSMQFDLMTYLRYTIAGKIARTSIVPFDKSRFSIQVDIQENHHSFSKPGIRTDMSKSMLNIPPLGALVQVRILPDGIKIDGKATIEQLVLEASAVRACFDAAYQPRTIEYVKQAQASISDIRSRIQERFPRPDQPHRDSGQKRSLKVHYAAQFVLEGIHLRCSAPALRPDLDYAVDLTIYIDPATLALGNIRPGTTELSEMPNFDFSMHRLAMSLERVGRCKENFGTFDTGVRISGTTKLDHERHEVRHFSLFSRAISLDLYAETAVLAVDLITFLQRRIKSLAAAEDAKKLKPLRRLTLAMPAEERPLLPVTVPDTDDEATNLLDSTFSVELNSICLRWLLGNQTPTSPSQIVNDMAFTVDKIDLQTKREASARLAIKGLQLQLVPTRQDPFKRTANSALLPEMIFNAAYGRASSTRKFAFKAAGKIVDVRLASNFVIPAAAVQKSLTLATSELRRVRLSTTKAQPESTQAQLPKLLGNKRLASLLVFADFAGAEVTITPAKEESQEQSSAFGFLKGAKRSKAGRYGQAVQSVTGEDATLRAPGIAFQVEYQDNGAKDPTLSMEIRVAASSNTLAPSVVPLILEISSSVTNMMEQDNNNSSKDTKDSPKAATSISEQSLQQATDPTAILGRVKLNAELWVQKQEFSLTCQPVARVSATARFDDIFVVVSTVQPKEAEQFFSISTTFSNLAASVQHVYSRESTASFAVDSIIVSLMNSKHFSDKSGISAILDVSPVEAYLNAKQMQDFLLFREIWYPPELRSAPKPPSTAVNENLVQGPAIQRFQEVTTTAVLPWHALVSIQELRVLVDFGQSIGKADFVISKLWASSKKSSDAEQNLCVGFNKIGIENSGRMSGFVELQSFRVRTVIRWPTVADTVQAPLVQGSVGFEHLRAKAAFDYQPFAVVDISSFDFLIYNVRQDRGSDRLVGILDGGKIQVFCTTSAAAQALSIHQAFERLVQEKQEAFESSLHELDRYLRRKSVIPSATWKPMPEETSSAKEKSQRPSHAPRLHVDVVITLRTIDAGVFMSSFFDETTLKLEAVDVQARFAVGDEGDKTHSGLGMSLGQVRVALSAMSRPDAKALGEVSVMEVIDRATNARGGTILKVPRLVASMQTWQKAPANIIEYIFSSTFHGKVDIGWNYSRISTIRRMWENHSRALAQKMNKPLPPSAIKITAEPQNQEGGEGKEKITAVVNMPQSKYEYIPLEPPIIDTPQLRDLGEATPSLEWIGLQRERLPHVTHSVIIVSLLEVAKEVEDTYSRILGSG